MSGMILKKGLAAAIAASAVLLSGCLGDGSENSSADSPAAEISSEVSFSVQSVLSQIDNELLDTSAFFGDEIFTQNCEKLFEVSAEKILDGGILYCSNAANADEVSMIKLADGCDGEQILTCRLESRLSTFESYRPEEMDKLSSARIFSAGGCWVLIISDNTDEIQESITSLVEHNTN